MTLGRFWDRTDDGRFRCDLCPRHCVVRPGQRAFCYVRMGTDEGIALDTYGRSSGFIIDPIEKKPLNHFLPGTPILSFGTAGCNLGCRFCQNWDISKARSDDRLMSPATPRQLAIAAQRTGCRSIAFTYNDPVIFAEYAIDVAHEARAAGLKSVAVTAGYITKTARPEFYAAMDAANIDLKGFTEAFYEKICFARLPEVLDTIAWVCNETDVWVELTNLVIPGANDADAEFDAMTKWILREIGPDVPLHFTAFHPDFKMMDRPHTPVETLLRAREIAIGNGLHYVYTGNVHHEATGSTWCHGCGALLIQRDWYDLGTWALSGSKCRQCGATIPGVFEDRPGHWGRRRERVDVARVAPIG